MKKLVLFVAFVLAGLLTASAGALTTNGTKPAVGNGSKKSPYEITTAEELRWFVHYENTRHCSPSEYAELKNDIDLSTICGPDKGSWIPLGYSEENGALYYFEGNFDGRGHTISGLYIDYEDVIGGQGWGLFGVITNVEIKNLTVEGKIINGNFCVGGIVGKSIRPSIIENCVSKVDIQMNGKEVYPKGVWASTKAGGIIGHVYGSGDYYHPGPASILKNCSYQGTITGTVGHKGSLVGFLANAQNVTSCSAYTNDSLPLIGHTWSATRVKNCISSGPIIGLYDTLPNLSSAILRDNLYIGQECVEEIKSPNTGGDCAITQEELANGAACYMMNQKMEGAYYTQTIGTDVIPFPNNQHSVVYYVKNYTDCVNYNYVYSNSDEDITTNRRHTFAEGSDHCAYCDAPNPSSHACDGDYYLLSSKEDIEWLWDMVNEHGVTDLNVRLTADIDMENTPLAPLESYMGEFDGAGYTLSNLSIIGENSRDTGLVGCLKDGGSIHDLVISGTVTANTSYNVGAFAGRVQQGCTLRNLRNDCMVYVTGAVKSGVLELNIGGIAGRLAGKAEACINNGTVADVTEKNTNPNINIAGIAGFAESTAQMSMLANNGIIGVSSFDGIKNGKAIANYTTLDQTPTGIYLVSDLKNPGFRYFCSGTPNSGETEVTQISVGSGELCYLLNQANGDNSAVFGQMIETDFVPYPMISEAHPQVYNTKHYYNCTDYSDYSNSETDETPSTHVYNSDGYCTLCYHANVSQDENCIYQIASASDWNKYAKALNAAYAENAPARFASAALTADITLDVADFADLKRDVTKEYASIVNLLGNIYGQGHSITFTNRSESGIYYLVSNLLSTGSISDLNVSTGYYSSRIVESNQGKVSGCMSEDGMIYRTNYGLVSDCFANQDFNILSTGEGCMVRCLQYTARTEKYTLRSKSVGSNICFEKSIFTKAQEETGELAYYISHMDPDQPCVWGQKLGTDTHPRPYYGQTPASDTYVTSLTSYSVEHPDGIVEYMNAGMALEAVPGCYMVCKDEDSWSVRPAYNFIIDNCDGTYSAEHINIDPTVEHYLPIEVNADKLTFMEVNEDGELKNKEYGFGEIVSLVFPIDMPVDNVNGHIHIFDGYDALNNTLVFTSSLDYSYDFPANTPVLIRTYGGPILNADLSDVSVMPMTVSAYSELENARHIAGYQQQTLPTDKAVEDDQYMLYYLLGGDKSHLKATLSSEDACTASQFASYFRMPYVAGAVTESEINVVLAEDRELKTSHLIERDVFSIPYGILDEAAQWEKVTHLNDSAHPNVFYGNDITEDNYANISAYDFLYIHGAPGQKYQFYFNGSEATVVEIDGDGDAFLDLDDFRVGIGDVYLRGIRLPEGETVPDDAYAKLYKYMEEGLVLIGYGDFSDELKGYPFYDATGVQCGITLNLDNPNAIVVGGAHIQGVYNRIEKSSDVMQGFTAEALRLTDGGDFCYDYSVKCPQVSFTRYDIPEGTRYVTFVLPFTAKYVKGMHEYIDCDGKNVYFNTPEDDVIDPYLPIVIDMEEYEGNTITIEGEDFLALSPNGVFNVAPIPSSKYDLKYGFVTRRQAGVSLDNAEISGYNVYGFSADSYKFVKAVNTFSVSPFRAFFMLPKSAAARTMGFRAPEAEVEAMDIVLDGEVINENTSGIADVISSDSTDSTTYNVLGIPVGPDYRGIAIRKGKKVVIK